MPFDRDPSQTIEFRDESQPVITFSRRAKKMTGYIVSTIIVVPMLAIGILSTTINPKLDPSFKKIDTRLGAGPQIMDYSKLPPAPPKPVVRHPLSDHDYFTSVEAFLAPVRDPGHALHARLSRCEQQTRAASSEVGGDERDRVGRLLACVFPAGEPRSGTGPLRPQR